jgi:titin
VSGLACSITGLQNGTTYTFTVRAGNVVGLGPSSNQLSATPESPGLPPSAPQSLAVIPNLPSGIGLSWTAPAPGTSPITNYRIYRGIPGGVLTLHATIGDALAFVDTSAANGSTYAYQVSAVNAVGEGSRSAPVTAQRGTAPSAPRNLTASASGKGITLKWSVPTTTGGAPITGYRVYRATTSGNATFLAAVGGTARTYLDASVSRKTRYYYTVTATNALGESVASAEVTVTSK